MFPVSFSAWQGAKISQLRKHSLTFGDVCDTHTDYSKKYTFLQRGGGGGGRGYSESYRLHYSDKSTNVKKIIRSSPVSSSSKALNKNVNPLSLTILLMFFMLLVVRI